MRILAVLLAMLWVFHSGCDKFVIPESPKRTDEGIIGQDGPEPMRGWDSVRIWGRINRGHYYDTGGDWYIVIEHDTLRNAEFTQMYMNPDEDSLGVDGWMYWKEYRASDRFLYIEDPLRAYLDWDYVAFAYRKPKYGGN